MFSKEMEALIEATLQDGKLDDLEKQALVERAEKEGVSQTELLVYINSIMQKRAQTKTAEEEAREEEKYEESLKQKGKLCPHCHAPLPPFADTCPECGAVILTAALNDKIDKMFADVRGLYSGGISHSLKDSEEKNKALGLLQKARTMNLELKMKYGSVQKVSLFCNQMESEINKAIDETKAKWTEEIKFLIGLLVCFILSLGLIGIAGYFRG